MEDTNSALRCSKFPLGLEPDIEGFVGDGGLVVKEGDWVVEGFLVALQSIRAQISNRSLRIAEKASVRQGKIMKGVFMLLSQNDLKSVGSCEFRI